MCAAELQRCLCAVPPTLQSTFVLLFHSVVLFPPVWFSNVLHIKNENIEQHLCRRSERHVPVLFKGATSVIHGNPSPFWIRLTFPVSINQSKGEILHFGVFKNP